MAGSVISSQVRRATSSRKTTRPHIRVGENLSKYQESVKERTLQNLSTMSHEHISSPKTTRPGPAPSSRSNKVVSYDTTYIILY